MTTRTAFLTVMLLSALPAAGAAGQAKPGAPRAADAAPQAAVDEQSARDTRERLRQILDQYPPSVAQVLRLDPSLLTKPDYTASYPGLAAYLAQHPEVAHDPVFFLGGAFAGQQYSDGRTRAMSAIESVFLGLEFLLGFVAATFTLGWITRSAIEHRRWLRATKIQTDAHTKIVDRLASNEDLLAYLSRRPASGSSPPRSDRRWRSRPRRSRSARRSTAFSGRCRPASWPTRGRRLGLRVRRRAWPADSARARRTGAGAASALPDAGG